MSATDRAIRASTTVAVLGVAGIAAYVSYWHAYEVIRAHGETGVTARLEPATIDGLVYCSSMVVLYAARHQLRVPGLARWLLALGIMATLAANVAHGWSQGPVGAVVAAWPAASLVGSYELLLWLIRTASAGSLAREPVTDQTAGPAGQPFDPGEQGPAELRLVPKFAQDPPERRGAAHNSELPSGPDSRHREPAVTASRASGPDRVWLVQADQCADQEQTDWPLADGLDGGRPDAMDAAAVAAYRASVDSGSPLSERKLAAMFGKTSRRWARNRMAEARRIPVSPVTDMA